MFDLWSLDQSTANSKQPRAFSTGRPVNHAGRNAILLFYATIFLVALSFFIVSNSPDLSPPAGNRGSSTATKSRLELYPDMRVADTPPFQSALEKASAKEVSVRDERIASANRTFSSKFPKDEDPAGRLIVITMDRATSLQRLLKSLAAADYGDDHVDLDIWIDHRPNIAIDAEVFKVAHEIEWNFGTKTIYSRRESGGLYQQWIYTWKITDQTDEIAVILEDDLEVSNAFYQWLKQARSAYASDQEVGAFTLQRSTLRPRQVPGVTKGPLNIPKAHHLFKYRLLGSWGFAPQRGTWVEFRAWFEKMRKAGKKPYVDNLITTQWYKNQEKDGFAPHMWTQWWIKFVDEKKYFTVTPHLPDGTTLCANWRERGMHYSTRRPTRDFPVYTGTTDGLHWPESPIRVDWDGLEIK